MEETKPLSFGRYLKAVRLEKAMALEEVSKETRISVRTLLFIENEEHDKLPPEVFVKGFLRAYARAVGADEDLAVQAYLSDRHPRPEPVWTDNKPERASTKRFWLRLGLSLGVLACFMALTICGVQLMRNEPEKKKLPVSPAAQNLPDEKPFNQLDTARAPDKPEVENIAEETSKEPLSTVAPVVLPEKKGVEKLYLNITAVEKTWIKVIIDGQEPKEYTLKPADKLDLEAFRGYSLLIGNAGGLKLSLNGRPVGVPGKSGQVVTLQIP